jgi:hypothetical protein
VVDTNGNLLRTFTSAAQRYGIGLELVNGVLYGAERDGQRRLVGMNPQTGAIISAIPNPYQQFYGPRCLTADSRGNFLQMCTQFSESGGGLLSASIGEIPQSNPTTIAQALPLETPNGLINGRGLEIDERDETMWVSEYGGSIFKITGLRFQVPPLTSSVDDHTASLDGVVTIAPHPVGTTAFVNISSVEQTRMITPTITDLTGRTVWSGPRHEQPSGEPLAIRLPDDLLASGSYILVLSSDEGASTRRPFLVSK